jgi:thiamine biosynthesis lipoprotein
LPFFLLALFLWAQPSFPHTVKDVRKKMGSRFEMTAVHPDRGIAQKAVDSAYAEVDRLEGMISSWKETSETAKINKNAGREPVRVSRELFNLIRRALKVSRLTDGAFDITFAGVGRLWDFKASDARPPSPDDVRKAMRHVGYKNVVLDEKKRTVFLRDSKARIGLGGIGKGYAANRAVILLKENGVEHGVVNAGGDLVAFGRREDGAPWDITIAHPLRPDRVFARIELTEQAVVTSGDYESFMVADGKRYGHILDPGTGYPADALRSVTVVCPDAELADALATAVFVMGSENGLSLVNDLHGVECIVVDRDGKILFSKNMGSQLLDREAAS